jgi:hypothetical protein
MAPHNTLIKLKDLELGTWNLELGTWDLGLGTCDKRRLRQSSKLVPMDPVVVAKLHNVTVDPIMMMS